MNYKNLVNRIDELLGGGLRPKSKPDFLRCTCTRSTGGYSLKDPTLSDVLRVLDIVDESTRDRNVTTEYGITSRGEFLYDSCERFLYEDDVLIRWDLTKNLSDQSEELKNFIWNLIKES